MSISQHRAGTSSLTMPSLHDETPWQQHLSGMTRHSPGLGIVAQRVHAGAFGHPAPPPRATKGTLETAARDGSAMMRQTVRKTAACRGWEEPLARLMGAPIVAPSRGGRGGEGRLGGGAAPAG